MSSDANVILMECMKIMAILRWYEYDESMQRCMQSQRIKQKTNIMDNEESSAVNDCLMIRKIAFHY